MESVPQCDYFGIIDHEDCYRYSTDLGQGLEFGTIPSEVFRPVVSAWMEQTNNLAGVWIDPSDVGPLETIAMDASKREILVIRCAAMLTGDDVIDLERGGVELGRQLAVFASGIGSLPSPTDELRIQYV